MRGEVHIERLVLHGLPPDVDVDRLVTALEASLADWFLDASASGWSSMIADRARPVTTTVPVPDARGWGTGIATGLGQAVRTTAAAPDATSPTNPPVEA